MPNWRRVRPAVYGGCHTNGPVRPSAPRTRPTTSGPPAEPSENSPPATGTLTAPSARPAAMPMLNVRMSISPSARYESPKNPAISFIRAGGATTRIRSPSSSSMSGSATRSTSPRRRRVAAASKRVSEVEVADAPAGDRAGADDDAAEVEVVPVELDLLRRSAGRALQRRPPPPPGGRRRRAGRPDAGASVAAAASRCSSCCRRPKADRAAVPLAKLVERARGTFDEHRLDDERRRARRRRGGGRAAARATPRGAASTTPSG